MIDIAKARTSAVLPVDYRVIDAVDSEALLSLGGTRFDAAVCSMALMDMSDIAPLIGALPALLKPGGRFVFTVMHPLLQFTRNGNGHGATRTRR